MQNWHDIQSIEAISCLKGYNTLSSECMIAKGMQSTQHEALKEHKASKLCYYHQICVVPVTMNPSNLNTWIFNLAEYINRASIESPFCPKN